MLQLVVLFIFVFPTTLLASHAPIDSPHAHMLGALSSARMVEPAAVATALTNIIKVDHSSKHDAWLADLRGFDGAERAELYETLRVAGVALVDRSKLRRLATTPGWQNLLESTVVEREEDKPRGNIRDHRQLQQSAGSGGVSLEAGAIFFTGLIGVVGYVVQARSALSQSKAQAGLKREAAEVEKIRARAAAQLGRVQTQIEYIQRVNGANSMLGNAMALTWLELGLSGILSQTSTRWCSPIQATPHIKLYDAGHAAKNFGKYFMMAPYTMLWPEDLALVASEPVTLERYQQLILHTWMPPLREIVSSITGGYHLIEAQFLPKDLYKIIPGLGEDVDSIGSISAIFYHTYVYAHQCELLVEAWARGDNSRLQPTQPCLQLILQVVLGLLKKAASEKELQLVGMSSGTEASFSILSNTGSAPTRTDST